MNIFKLIKSEILDRYVRENFQRIEDHIRADPFQLGRFIFIAYRAEGLAYPATVELPHTLGFVPKDVIQLYVSPDDTTVTWNYDDFTRTTLSVTVSAACDLRAYFGRYGDT